MAFATTTVIVAGITVGMVAKAAMVVGTALSIAGALTGNKTMRYVGMGIGLAGGLTSLAGAVNLFGFGGEAAGHAAVDATTETAVAQGGAALDPAAQVGAGTVLAPAAEQAAQVGAGTVLAPPTDGGLFGAGAPAIGTPAYIPTPMTGVEGAVPSAPQGMIGQAADATSGALSTGAQTNQAVNPPPTPEAPPAPQYGTIYTNPIGPGVGGQPMSASVMGGPAPGETTQSWWSKLDPVSRMYLVSTVGQGASGMIGGMFAARSASERLELERLVQNERNQLGMRQLDLEKERLGQQQTLINRSTSTPGTITFGRR